MKDSESDLVSNVWVWIYIDEYINFIRYKNMFVYHQIVSTVSDTHVPV